MSTTPSTRRAHPRRRAGAHDQDASADRVEERRWPGAWWGVLAAGAVALSAWAPGCGCEGKSTDDSGETTDPDQVTDDGEDAATTTAGTTDGGDTDGEPSCTEDAPARYSDECPGQDLWTTQNHCGECDHYCTTPGLDSRGNILPGCVCGECPPFWSDCQEEGLLANFGATNCNELCENYGGGTVCVPFGCGGYTLIRSPGSDPFFTYCPYGSFIDGHDCETPFTWSDEEDFEWAACCCTWPEQ